MATLTDARAVLLRHFGFPDFRPSQREVVRSVLGGRDTLAVLPTGAGKSACFQVPALLLDGITVVVSPLISLMTDQVAACQRRGIAAAALTSATSPVERLVVMEALRNRSIRLLYLSPERLGATAASLRQQAGVPALLAVDEAHCISEWGPDFRPSYRQLGAVRRQLGMPPVVALTGSATPEVRRDITRQLAFRPGAAANELIASFDRPNLHFNVRIVTSEAERFKAMLAYLDGSSPLAIVYTPTRSVTEALTRALRHAGYDAVPYHAGLTSEYRLRALERFTSSRLQVVVATCAFGMGIDAPNVRLVVHWAMPPTLESYYQEAGRAGRDGGPARCVLLYRNGDGARQREQLDSTFPHRGRWSGSGAIRARQSAHRRACANRRSDFGARSCWSRAGRTGRRFTSAAVAPRGGSGQWRSTRRHASAAAGCCWDTSVSGPPLAPAATAATARAEPGFRDRPERARMKPYARLRHPDTFQLKH